ncbi:MAG: hypothetical protein ACFE0I_01055 [Elainellaceae cyanobacterium]
MKGKTIEFKITNAFLRVEGSTYQISNIASADCYQIKTNLWDAMTVGKRYGIWLNLTSGRTIPLVRSTDKESIFTVRDRIEAAMDAQSRGVTYNTKYELQGDFIKQDGNFGTGVNFSN